MIRWEVVQQPLTLYSSSLLSLARYGERWTVGFVSGKETVIISLEDVLA
jgi:hypothetical protein